MEGKSRHIYHWCHQGELNDDLISDCVFNNRILITALDISIESLLEEDHTLLRILSNSRSNREMPKRKMVWCRRGQRNHNQKMAFIPLKWI